MAGLVVRRALALGLVTAAILLVALVGWQIAGQPPPIPSRAAVVAVVVDELGRPVAGVSVGVGEQNAVSGPDGAVSLELSAPVLARFTAASRVERVQALDPQRVARVILPQRTPSTVTMRFGGDVMMGRRFYEPGADASPAILSPSADAGEHAELLGAIQPLLSDADLTVVNLETALVSDPARALATPRPAQFHPTKDLIIASSPQTAAGLALAGVDVVSLANNHTYDALAEGLTQTIASLDAAGVAHFGAGATPEQAWAPAVVSRAGQRIALLGCTTVQGQAHPIQYVATAEQGGAAACSDGQLGTAVRQVRAQADIVVVLLHGDVEYQRDQTPLIRDLAQTATDAGAALVVTSHPHVIGGLTSAATGGGAIAESTGNLAFDQNLWATFPSYLLRAEVTAGHPVSVSADPLLIDDYRPRPVTGPPADAVARIVAGTVPGPARLDGPGALMTWPERPAATPRQAQLTPGQVHSITPGWWLQSAPGAVRVGTELLYGTGRFDPSTADGGPLPAVWEIGANAALASEAQCGPSGSPLGLRLRRSPLSTVDVVAAPQHRVPVTAGTSLSLVVDVRSASASGQLELRWYADLDGPSVAVDSVAIPEVVAGSTCRTIRLELTVPAGAVAARPFVRLSPTEDTHAGADLLVDNLRLIAWAPAGASGRVFDSVEATGDQPGVVTMGYDPPVGPTVTPEPLRTP